MTTAPAGTITGLIITDMITTTEPVPMLMTMPMPMTMTMTMTMTMIMGTTITIMVTRTITGMTMVTSMGRAADTTIEDTPATRPTRRCGAGAAEPRPGPAPDHALIGRRLRFAGLARRRHHILLAHRNRISQSSPRQPSGHFPGTIRGRVGYAFDRVPVSGTGRFAYASVRDQAAFRAPRGDPAVFGNRSRVDTGCAAGDGIAYALPTDPFLNVLHASVVTVRAEALSCGLGRGTLLPPAAGRGQGASVTRFQNEGVLGRVGLTYTFGS